MAVPASEVRQITLELTPITDDNFTTRVTKAECRLADGSVCDGHCIKVQHKQNNKDIIEVAVANDKIINEVVDKCKRMLQTKIEFRSNCFKERADGVNVESELKLLGSTYDFAIHVKLGNEQFAKVGVFSEGRVATISAKVPNDLTGELFFFYLRLLVKLKNHLADKKKAASADAKERADKPDNPPVNFAFKSNFAGDELAANPAATSPEKLGRAQQANDKK